MSTLDDRAKKIELETENSVASQCSTYLICYKLEVIWIHSKSTVFWVLGFEILDVEIFSIAMLVKVCWVWSISLKKWHEVLLLTIKCVVKQLGGCLEGAIDVILTSSITLLPNDSYFYFQYLRNENTGSKCFCCCWMDWNDSWYVTNQTDFLKMGGVSP